MRPLAHAHAACGGRRPLCARGWLRDNPRRISGRGAGKWARCRPVTRRARADGLRARVPPSPCGGPSPSAHRVHHKVDGRLVRRLRLLVE
eukprot:1339886-Prymnesium_polylepis.1